MSAKLEIILHSRDQEIFNFRFIQISLYGLICLLNLIPHHLFCFSNCQITLLNCRCQQTSTSEGICTLTPRTHLHPALPPWCRSLEGKLLRKLQTDAARSFRSSFRCSDWCFVLAPTVLGIKWRSWHSYLIETLIANNGIRTTSRCEMDKVNDIIVGKCLFLEHCELTKIIRESRAWLMNIR